jgi:hypothetical protein
MVHYAPGGADPDKVGKAFAIAACVAVILVVWMLYLTFRG